MNNILSVIIPTYNRSNYIQFAVESVINQKIPKNWNMEIIIVDDGSTDDTEKVLKQIHRSNIHYYKIQHSGKPAVVRNFGIKKSKGSLIAFQDSDDLWVEDKFIKQNNIFKNNKIMLSFGNAEIMNSNGIKSGKFVVEFNKLKNGHKFNSLIEDNVISTLTVMVRKTAIEQVGYFDESDNLRAVEDYDLWLRIANKFPDGIMSENETLAFYRQHEANVSHASSLLATERLHYIFDKLWSENLSKSNRLALENRIEKSWDSLNYFYYLEHDKPKVSVIMSAYNSAHHLLPALDSILYQTYEDFELLIVDDGSSDDTIKIVESYKDARIKLIKQTNHGLVYSLNKAIKLAQGEYLARHDSDDISNRNRFEKQVDWLDTSKDNGLVGSFFAYIDEDNNTTGTVIYTVTKNIDLKRMFYLTNPIPHGGSMFRKKAFEQAGGYRQEYYKAEDYDLWRRIIENWNVGQIPEILYWYRINPNGISQNNGKEQKILSDKIVKEQYHSILHSKGLISIARGYYYYLKMNSYYNKEIAQMYKDQQIQLAFNFYIYGHIAEGVKTTLGSLALQPIKSTKMLWRITLWAPFKKILGKSL